MDPRLILLSVLVLAIGVQCVTEPTYVVAAPNSVHPFSTYTVLVSLHNSETPLDVKVTVSGTNNSVSGQTTVPPEQSRKIVLQIGDWNTADSLLVEGSGAANFSTSQSIRFNPKRHSVFIQTDKAIYQPGQKVQFRVFVVDGELKPYASDLTIYISDPQNNRIKQYLNATLEKGVFSGDLQLSDRPVLGDWDIRVTVGTITQSKSVTVEEYVLPTYEVKVFPPPYATYNDTAAPVRVEAKYTFGKPVRGPVVLYVSDSCQKYRYYNECIFRPNISATLEKNGQVVIPVDVSRIRYPQFYYSSQNTLDLLAVVTEELTGKTFNASASLTIYPHIEKLEISVSPDKFRPGLPIQLTVTLSDQDNKPIINPDAPVNITVTFQTSNKPVEENHVVNVPANGIVELDLNPPAETKSMSIQATYKDADTAYQSVNIAPSLSKKFILIELNSTKSIAQDSTATFCVKTTFKIDQLSYEISSGGDIVQGETLKFQPTTAQNLVVNVTHSMTPRARLIVYVVTDCGEILSDSFDFKVDGFFLTPVTLTASPNETKPGGAVAVEIDTTPTAMVYLLGIDQSVLLLKSGNDITKREVEDDLAQYDSSNTPYYGDGPSYRRYYWRPPTQGVERIFQDAGLIFYSNALYQKESFYGGLPFRKGAGGGNIAFFAGGDVRPAVFKESAQLAQNAPKVRSLFPETWIWHSIAIGSNGIAVYNTTVPDTITSWIISAVVMDDETGLGLPDNTAKVTVFKPFFVNLNLPYSVIRGETLKLQALVFNYMKDDVQTNVTLFNEDGDFEFVEGAKDATSQSKAVTVPAGDAVSVVFPIIFKKVGYIKIKVSAIAVSPISAGDAIQKELIVKPEGTTKYFNKAILFDLRQKRSITTEANITYPEDVVEDSERVEVSVVGDIMGPTLKNIDNLLRVPYGCGEQNMINFVPNVVVANYLDEVGELTQERKDKAVSNMAAGYQRQLNYKHSDGSFSAFGNSDVNGSTWLTAYVAKSFAQAKPFIDVDDNILEQALDFLNGTQAPDGTFVENGQVSHKAMQGGAATSGLSLTAYVLIAFKEVGNTKYQSTEDAATKALEQRLPNAVDPYEVSVLTYALHKANSPLKDQAFTKLKNLASQEGELVYWKKLTNGTVTTFPSYDTDSTSSLNVEATAYGLLTYNERGLIADAIPIVRWLVGQRNEYGGFASTQDTVIGLEALATTAAELKADPNSNVDVEFKYGGRSKRFAVTKDTSLLLQQEVLPPDTSLVEATGTGNGVCIAQITWSYNYIDLDLSGTFSINAKVDSQTGDSYKLTVCAKYTDKDGEATNMAIIELNTQSGYSFDKENQPTGAKRIEYADGDTKINAYYDQITGSDTCITAAANRNNEVENLKASDVVVYDYYQRDKRAVTRYQIK